MQRHAKRCRKDVLMCCCSTACKGKATACKACKGKATACIACKGKATACKACKGKATACKACKSIPATRKVVQLGPNWFQKEEKK